MKKLRLQFAIFFFLLQAGILFLLLNSYRQMSIEEKSLWESESTKVYNQMQAQISDLLNIEDARSFKEYRFVSRSPLSDLTTLNSKKAWLGYFQIDPDGSFSTPYLPGEQNKKTENYSERLQKQKALEQATLSFRKEMKGAFAERSIEDKRDKKSYAAEKVKAAPNIYPNPIQSKSQQNRLNTAPLMKKEAPQLARREEAAAEDSIQTFEKNSLSTSAGAPATAAAPQPTRDAAEAAAAPVEKELIEKDTPLEKQKRALAPKKMLESKKVPSQIISSAAKPPSSSVASPNTSIVWLDPFQTKISGSFLLFFRRVWVEEKMYLQGFVLQTQPFFESLMQNSFENSDLPNFSFIRWVNKEEAIAQYGRIQNEATQKILFERDMEYPLGNLALRIMGKAWPQISTRLYLNLFSGGLFLFSTLGLFWIYRSSAAHIRLSQKRQDFVSAISHELKTPLTSIRMYSEMLEDGWVEDENKKKEYYRNIHQESERLSRLIENVLQMSRLEKQTYRLNLVRQNPSEDLRSWEKQFKELAAREGFSFHLELEAELPSVEYDPEALKEVLLILLENSIKFSKTAAHKKINLILKKEKSYLNFIWRDEGPGVPEKELNQIFEKFYRVENELTRKTKGTGIGLAIAQATVQAMGAKIEARNLEIQGLEIVVSFTI